MVRVQQFIHVPSSKFSQSPLEQFSGNLTSGRQDGPPTREKVPTAVQNAEHMHVCKEAQVWKLQSYRRSIDSRFFGLRRQLADILGELNGLIDIFV